VTYHTKFELFLVRNSSKILFYATIIRDICQQGAVNCLQPNRLFWIGWLSWKVYSRR